MTPESRAKWLETGVVPPPTPKPAAEPAVPAARAAGDDDADPDALPAAGAAAAVGNAAVDAAAGRAKPDTPRADTWEDPTTGDRYDMRTRAGRRIKALGGIVKSLEARIAELQAGKPAGPDLSAAAPGPTSPAPTAGDPEPLESEIGTKFKDWNDYNDKRIEWKARAIAAQMFGERDERDRTARARAAQTETLGKFAEQLEKVKAEVPDFDALMDVDYPISPLMHRHVLESEVGALMAVRFARNPTEAVELAALTDERVVLKRLGRIEGELIAGRATPGNAAAPAPQPKLVSGAPEPPTLVSQRGAQPINEKDRALKSGDFRAFNRAFLADEIAKRKPLQRAG